MKKVLFFFITAILLCITSALKAQNTTIQIGAGNDTIENLPTNTFNTNSLSQQIYTATEIGQSGTIYSIAFYNISPNVTRNMDLYLAHTNKTAFSSDNDWSAVATGDLVFSGYVTFVQNQWSIVEFTTPFAYNGTDNLLVVVDDNSEGWVADRYFLVFNATGQAIFDNSDNTNYDPTNPSGYEGNVSNVKNQIQLNFAHPSCPAPTSLAVSNIEPTSVTLSWTENGSATAWDICLNGNENNIITVYTNPYVLTNLTPGMPYSVSVRANCGDGVSVWAMENFLTSTCSSPSNLYASNISQTSVTLNWIENGSATAWDIRLNDNEDSIITVYTNPYVLTGLTPGTQYYVTVRANCGDSNNVSYWTDEIFTTVSNYQIQSTANWYGYAINSFLDNGEYAHNDWEKEFISFSMQNLASVTAITDMNLSSPYTYSATYVNGSVWCITCQEGHLCRASIHNNSHTISDFEIVFPYFDEGSKIESMSYNPVDGRFYYIFNGHYLKSFHPSQPENVIDVGSIGFDAKTLAINNVGEAYIIQNTTGDLYQLDLNDASATLIGSTGLPAQHVQSMAFDQNTGELFWAQYYSRFSSHGLYLVDPATAETQFLGRINGDGCQLACFFMVDTSHHDGVQILPENSIVLYPNPAKEIVNVEYTMYKHMDIETVEVIDVYGKVVRTAVETNNHLPLQTAQINVSNLSDGLYFVRVTTSTGQITKPFIKQ